jgi:hypothetical protein
MAVAALARVSLAAIGGDKGITKEEVSGLAASVRTNNKPVRSRVESKRHAAGGSFAVANWLHAVFYSG